MIQLQTGKNMLNYSTFWGFIQFGSSGCTAGQRRRFLDSRRHFYISFIIIDAIASPRVWLYFINTIILHHSIEIVI